ncbi:hypothetical protein [Nocardioides aurantiacus]|uniref:Uncharacterized protein n=1 Tax=Nocardioides aurantiacus TaxID=86796 RepID=A0A3N2CVA9_9ACTN|nr:hypothetical protein [Nocardioides aurantiacus]ROR91467.1 hypothetical protein EDD33_2334 [Nocardioides aurantiacus]
MTAGFHVDLAALMATRDYLDDIGSAIGEINVAQALETCNGVGAEATTAAVKDVAFSLGAAVAGYAVDTVALASKTGATISDYAAIDDGVSSTLRRLAL